MFSSVGCAGCTGLRLVACLFSLPPPQGWRRLLHVCIWWLLVKVVEVAEDSILELQAKENPAPHSLRTLRQLVQVGVQLSRDCLPSCPVARSHLERGQVEYVAVPPISPRAIARPFPLREKVLRSAVRDADRVFFCKVKRHFFVSLPSPAWWWCECAVIFRQHGIL